LVKIIVKIFNCKLFKYFCSKILISESGSSNQRAWIQIQIRTICVRIHNTGILNWYFDEKPVFISDQQSRRTSLDKRDASALLFNILCFPALNCFCNRLECFRYLGSNFCGPLQRYNIIFKKRRFVRKISVFLLLRYLFIILTCPKNNRSLRPGF
jgi:hypothetical protein